MKNEIVNRPDYEKNIGKFKDLDFVKVFTGIRRCGKTKLMELVKSSMDDCNIIDINFEDSQFFDIKTYKELAVFVENKLQDDKKNYLFFDEIQEVEGWEKAVNSFRLKNADIYITGSNSKILNSEYTTILGGRIKSFEILPLSFREFLEFRKCYSTTEVSELKKELDRYIKIGGFPSLTKYNFSEDDAIETLKDIFTSALKRDVINRNTVKNTQLMDKIIEFIYDNVGNLISIKSIVDYLKSQGRRGTDAETIANYLRYLEGGYLIRKASRYDIKGKRLLETNDKYYLTDHSLQYVVRSFRQDNIQGVLENIVYMELNRRGYKVYVGKFDDKEIDFVAQKDNAKIYVQVCYSLTTPEVYSREYKPLKNIKDHYPKYVVVLKEDNLITDDEGVKGVLLQDFLLSDTI